MQTLTSSDCTSMLITGLNGLDEKVRLKNERQQNLALMALLRRNVQNISFCAWAMGEDEVAVYYSGLFR